MAQSKDEDLTFDLGDITLTGYRDEYITDSDTISIDISYYTVSTIDISDISTTTISDPTWDTLTGITFDRVMFEDDMPDPQTLKRMSEEYPALEKAYENFKTIYKLVEQDWKGKSKSETDDDFPF